MTRGIKFCGLKSSIEVHYPTVSGNLLILKKKLYSCLCASFVSCCCILLEKMDENGSFKTIAPFSSLRNGPLLASFRVQRLKGVETRRLLQATVLTIPFLLPCGPEHCTGITPGAGAQTQSDTDLIRSVETFNLGKPLEVSISRSRMSLNSRDFGAMWKQPVIPGNLRLKLRACRGAGEEDRVMWLELRPGWLAHISFLNNEP